MEHRTLAMGACKARNTVNSVLSIQPEPAYSVDAKALVGELDACLNAVYAPENRHGLPIAALQDESVTFLVARWEGIAVGCGAIKFFEEDYAEVKRMYVTPQYRGKGVAQALIKHLERLSLENGFYILRLETGVHQNDAVRLYEQAGFSRCPPFGKYLDDGVSLCYEKVLSPIDKNPGGI